MADHDKASALGLIPPALHDKADALAAAGFNWTQILAIIQAILAGLSAFKPPVPPTPPTS